MLGYKSGKTPIYKSLKKTHQASNKPKPKSQKTMKLNNTEETEEDL